MELLPGMIVWATVPDRNGHPKDRPLVILAAPPDTSLPFICCACTTKDLDPRPDQYVRLPWDAHGKSMTGLTEQCYAVTDWGVKIMPSQVRRTSGKISPAIFAKIMQKIGRQG
jgi:hypothetical protein